MSSEESQDGTQQPEVEEHKSSENENVEESEINEEEIEQLKDSVDEDLYKKLKSASVQKKHWRDKYNKLKEQGQQPQEEKAEEPKAEKPKKPEKLETRLARFELKDQARDIGLKLDSEDMDHAFALAEGYKTDPVKVLDNPVFKAYLDNKNQQKADEGATPAPSGRAVPQKVNKKDHSIDELTEMIQKDPQKYERIMREKYDTPFRDSF